MDSFVSSLNDMFSSDELIRAQKRYEIRDLLIGDNCVKQDIPRALELAATHRDEPETRWIADTFAGKNVQTNEEARDVLQSLGEDDKVAAFFCWILGGADWTDYSRLLRCAEHGNAFAQAWMCRRSEKVERFKFARLAALQKERSAFYWLGDCYSEGEGCESNFEEAKNCFLIGAELGDASAMVCLGDLLDDWDPKRWHWWGRAAGLGHRAGFRSDFMWQVLNFKSGIGSAPVVCAIGKALVGQIDVQKEEIFEDHENFFSLVGPAQQAVEFYQSQVKAARKAVDAWTCVGIRLNVVKDIRKLIGGLIWDARDLAEYGEHVSAVPTEKRMRVIKPNQKSVRFSFPNVLD